MSQIQVHVPIHVRIMSACPSWEPALAEDAAKKEVLRMSGVTWSGSAHGSVFIGVLPGGMGAFVYQYEGNRLIATIDAWEATTHKNPDLGDLISDDSQTTAKFKALLQDCSGYMQSGLWDNFELYGHFVQPKTM